MVRSRFAELTALCLLLGACAGGPSVSFKQFGSGQPRATSAQKCIGQGYREDSDGYGECIAFYDKQTFTNRRNIVLAVGVAALAVFAFEEECYCMFGPYRGTKFNR